MIGTALMDPIDSRTKVRMQQVFITLLLTLRYRSANPLQETFPTLLACR